jgi:aspartyl-tRNA(Asn)/glutamyl-tRNA(Gln) amidotransferase subunit A
LFREIDLLAYPTLPFAGARIGAEKVPTGSGEEDVRVASIRLNRPGNLTGYPAISIPCGLTAGHLPVGLQLMAAPFRESLLLQVAHWYEQEAAWIDSGQWIGNRE